MVILRRADVSFRRLGNKVIRFIDNLSIRAKFFTYAAVLISLMLVLCTLVLYGVNEIQHRHIPARAAARDMEASLLNMRIHELNLANDADSLNAEFYLKQKSPHVDAWQESYRTFEMNYTKLTHFKDKSVQAELDRIQPSITAYRDSFLALTGAYRERGFQSFGREGVLRQRMAALQSGLSNAPLVQISFLKVQEAQNTFLLYREPTSILAFHTYANELKAQLVKPTDQILFEEYVHMFNEVVAINQKIGLTNTEGLRGQLNTYTNDITPHIQAAESSVLQSTSASIASIARSISIATITVAIVAIFMAFMLARLIVKRISLLSEASQRIAAGNLQYRLPADTKDELGKLSTSFNTMAEKLQKNQQILHERATALSQSVKRFELVSRIVNEAIYDWNVNTGELTWGEGIVSVFGYKTQDKVTTVEWWTDRIHPDDTESIDNSLNTSLSRHGDTWKKEYRFKKANGEYVYCQDRGFIEYRHNKPVRMVGSIIDISRQKALDRAKDEFISVASHQLRTPLGSIRWNLELLLEKERVLSKELSGYAHEAYTSTLRMAGLVNDLLSVARIEQDRVQHIPEKTDLVDIIKAAIAEINSIAKRRDIRIDISDLQKKHMEVILDPKRFREVIQNLLSNAVKYTPPKGSVAVTVEKHPKDFVVSISDNGIGIPAEDQSKLFTKFYRATNVTTTDTEGSGLGLFVVRSYVETWGGRIWFTSKENKGTTFYVSIPHKPHTPK